MWHRPEASLPCQGADDRQIHRPQTVQSHEVVLDESLAWARLLSLHLVAISQAVAALPISVLSLSSKALCNSVGHSWVIGTVDPLGLSAWTEHSSLPCPGVDATRQIDAA